MNADYQDFKYKEEQIVKVLKREEFVIPKKVGIQAFAIG